MTEAPVTLILTPEESHSKANINGINDSSGNGSTAPTAQNQSTTSPKDSKFDPAFTQNVIDATGPKASPRIKKVMASLIQHIHDFARENEITVEEWMAGVEMVGSPTLSSFPKQKSRPRDVNSAAKKSH